MNEPRHDPELIDRTEPVDPDLLAPRSSEPVRGREVPEEEDVNPDAGTTEPPD
jgi:hypothetical protein